MNKHHISSFREGKASHCDGVVHVGAASGKHRTRSAYIGNIGTTTASTLCTNTRSCGATDIALFCWNYHRGQKPMAPETLALIQQHMFQQQTPQVHQQGLAQGHPYWVTTPSVHQYPLLQQSPTVNTSFGMNMLAPHVAPLGAPHGM